MTSTSFVGRDRELHEARRILRAQRILTFVGGGGVGKTRLAVHLGANMARDFPGGVWLVDLSAVEPGTDVAAVVPDAGRLDGVLLILDTCEHLRDECGVFVSELIKRTTRTRVLVTGRRPLAVLGEHLLEVTRFGLPDAVRLFAERAPGLPFSGGLTAEVCSRLDGLPLAIELAAARLRVQSLPELLTSLDDPGQVLSLGNRIAPPRQRSLGALHDWSHALCTPGERDLWARLSVFEGDFDLAAAEAVCDGDGIVREEILDLIAGLVDESVVLRIDDGWYSLPGIARLYGARLLWRDGKNERFRLRHAKYCRELPVPASPVPDNEAAEPVDFGLTPREREVAELIRRGLTNQAIGGELGISKRTVESHVVRIMAKLGFVRRAQISAWVASARLP